MEIKLTKRGMAVVNRNNVNEEELGKYLTPKGVAVVKAMRKERQHAEYLKNCVEVERR